MIYDDGVAKEFYWEKIAKEAFGRIIEQNKKIEELLIDLNRERDMVRFLQDMAGKQK